MCDHYHGSSLAHNEEQTTKQMKYKLSVLASSPKYTGAATFAVTVSRDGNTLYAVNAGSNSIAVVPLVGANANTVSGMIPTAYEPHDITFSSDSSWMYIINGKSDTGPNPGHLATWPPGQQHRQPDDHHLPWWQCRGSSGFAGEQPIPIPVGECFFGQRARAHSRRLAGFDSQGCAEQYLFSGTGGQRCGGDEFLEDEDPERDLRRERKPHL
jgi:Lactonase, 7-bladed beta-propeller